MRCNYCEWRCDLSAGQAGVCRMYREEQGAVKERFPMQWSACSVSRMESMPFYHAHPDSRTLTIGTYGCNFSCRYCSNAHVARRDPLEFKAEMNGMAPEELIRMALKHGCQNIVFNVNEPAMSLQSLLKLKQNADQAGLPMGCLTNAYTTEESTEILAAIFSFLNIGLKGFSAEFHRNYIGIGSIDPILRNISRLAKIRHIEVTTPVIEGVNDSELGAISEFIAGIDPDIPWHVFRLLPEHEMKSVAYPSIERINQLLQTARKKLSYVYFHNFVGSDWVNTVCPDCGTRVIERFSLGCGGDRMDKFLCKEGNQCPSCGRRIKIHGRPYQTDVKEAT
ncbi:MAG: radical SAM protein [Candidatus Wallbacteria bacterium]|nr:radical SAM protein [Candidatus Wallbacteria bacterium]